MCRGSSLLNGVTPIVPPVRLSPHPRTKLLDGDWPPVVRRPRPSGARPAYRQAPSGRIRFSAQRGVAARAGEKLLTGFLSSTVARDQQVLGCETRWDKAGRMRDTSHACWRSNLPAPCWVLYLPQYAGPRRHEHRDPVPWQSLPPILTMSEAFDSAWAGKAPGGIAWATFEGRRVAAFAEPTLAGFDKAAQIIETLRAECDYVLVAVDQPTVGRGAARACWNVSRA